MKNRPKDRRMNQSYRFFVFSFIALQGLFCQLTIQSGGKKNIKIVPTQKARIETLKKNKALQKRPAIKPLAPKRTIHPTVKKTKPTPTTPLPVTPKPVTQSIETQTETADPAILLALTGVLQETGDALFNYVDAICQYKKDLALSLTLKNIAREGYIALNAEINDAATLATIYEKTDLDSVIKEASQKANNLVAELKDLLLERAEPQDSTKRAELKKQVDARAQQISNEQDAARKNELESEIDTTIQTINEMQEMIKEQQKDLDIQIKKLTEATEK